MIERRGAAGRYFGAAERGEFMLPFCDWCDAPIFYPRDHCPRCHRLDVSWRKCPGTGTVYSFSVMHTHPDPSFKARAPYVVALVDLEEETRILTEVAGCPPDAVFVGMAVEIRFEHRDWLGGTVPVAWPALRKD